MNIRKLFRIALENYYIILHSGQSGAEEWAEDADRLRDICIKCGYKEDRLRKNAEEAYWNS